MVDYHAHLKRDGLQGARIGVLRKSMGYHPDVDAAFERAIEAIKTAGGVVVDADNRHRREVGRRRTRSAPV